MVAKNEEGQVTEVPGLKLLDEESLRRFAEGKALKLLVKQKQQLLKEKFHKMSISEILNSIAGENFTYGSPEKKINPLNSNQLFGS
jgi:hypothetical protein